MPLSLSSIARFRAVWPPRVGSRASGRSISMMRVSVAQVEGLDVGAGREIGVGHDGRRVGVDEHHLVALVGEHLARLRARVVELAGLADDDRPGADDEDLVEVVAARHG